MKGFLIIAAFGLGLIGATVPTAGTALASGEDDHRVYGGYSAQTYAGIIFYGPSYNYRTGHRRAHRHGHGKHFTYSPNRRVHHRKKMVYRAIQPCHSTSKAGFDDYGRRVRIGGTMCYDAYGAPYIVRGSRHIIHYY